MQYIATATYKNKLKRDETQPSDNLREVCERAGLMATNALLAGQSGDITIWEESGRTGPGQDPWNPVGKVAIDGKRLPLVMAASRKQEADPLARLMGSGSNLPAILTAGSDFLPPPVVACPYCDGVCDLSEHSGTHAGYRCAACGWLTTMSPSQIREWAQKQIVRADRKRLHQLEDYNAKNTLIVASYLEGAKIRMVGISQPYDGISIHVYDGADGTKVGGGWGDEATPGGYNGRKAMSLKDAISLVKTFLQTGAFASVEYHDPRLETAVPTEMFPKAPEPARDPKQLPDRLQSSGRNALRIWPLKGKAFNVGYPIVQKGKLLDSGKEKIELEQIGAVESALDADKYGRGRRAITWCREGFTVPCKDDSAETAQDPVADTRKLLVLLNELRIAADDTAEADAFRDMIEDLSEGYPSNPEIARMLEAYGQGAEADHETGLLALRAVVLGEDEEDED